MVRNAMQKTLNVTTVTGYKLNRESGGMEEFRLAIPQSFKSSEAAEKFLRKQDSSIVVTDYKVDQRTYTMPIDKFLALAEEK